jgi:hypothetical protein
VTPIEITAMFALTGIGALCWAEAIHAHARRRRHGDVATLINRIARRTRTIELHLGIDAPHTPPQAPRDAAGLAAMSSPPIWPAGASRGVTAGEPTKEHHL